MFIKNRDQYLVQENLKQAKEFLIKKGVSDEDKSLFKDIVKSLERLPNLIYTFTRMVYDHTGGWDKSFDRQAEALRIIQWIKDNRQIVGKLPKNIVDYTDLEELADDIVQLELNRKVYKFTKSLYRSMREEVSKLEGEELKRYNDLALSFMKLDDEYKSNFTPLKYFEKNNIKISEFMDALEKYINSQDINEERKRVLKYVKEHSDKLEVVYNQDNVIAIQSNDKETICELGSQAWCIVYSPTIYQNSYLSSDKMNTQYIIYNFNLPSTNENSMFGVTIKIDGEIYNTGTSQNRNNRYTPLSDIYRLTGIPEGTLRSMYKEDYDKFQNLIDNIKNVNSDELSDVMTEILNLSDKMSLNANISSDLVEWLFNNKSSVEENIKYIKLLRKNKDFKERGEFYIVKNHFSILEEIINEIIKSKESLFHYFINEKEIVEQFSSQIDLRIILTIIKEQSKFNLTLSDVAKLSFIDQHSIHIESYYRIFDYMKSYLNRESLINLKKDIPKLSKELSLLNLVDRYGDSLKEPNISRSLNETYRLLVQSFMENIDIDVMSYDEFKSNYKLFEDYLEENYLISSIKDIYDVYETKENISDIDNFMLSELKVDSLEELFDIDNYSYKNMPDDSFLEILGTLLIKKGTNPNDVDNIMLYSMYLSDSSYEEYFKKSIGLKYDSDNKVWYSETNYDTLGEYFKEKFYFENFDYNRYDQYYSGDRHHDEYTTEIDISNLLSLAHYFKESGFTIDIEPLKKFESEEYLDSRGNLSIDYKKSQKIYREDKEVKSVLSVVDDIVNERYDYEEMGNDEDPYDNIDVSEIQNIINRIYNNVTNDGSYNEYHSNQLEEIGSKFLTKWPDSEKSFSKYYKWGDGESILVIPDLNTLIDYNFFENIQIWVGSDFSIDDIIDNYLDQEGKLDWVRDDGYSWEDNDYDYYNERLSEELDMENIYYSVKDIIKKREEGEYLDKLKRNQLEMEFESRIIKFSNFK